MLKIQEQRHKPLQWFAGTPQVKLDIFKEGKTEASVCSIVHQWEKGDMRREYGILFKVLQKIIFLFHYLTLSHMMLPLFHSKSLTGRGSDTQLFKSMGVLTSVSVRAGIKLKMITEVMQWASKSSQWLLSKTNPLLGRKDELMCTAESSWRQTSWKAKKHHGQTCSILVFF